MEGAIITEDLLDEDHIVCQTALSACEELIKELSNEEKKSVINSVIDVLPEEETLLIASSLFENILEKRDPNLAGFMPRDFIEKSLITTHTLALNNAESNVLYNLVRAVSCSQFGSQHLPLDSLAFSVVSLILSSLFDTGAEEFHMSKNGDTFASWLDQVCPNENADVFLERMNKLLFPWDNLEYDIKSDAKKSKMILNVLGEYKSVFEQNEELGGVLETMVLEPTQKQIELCVCSEKKNLGNEDEMEVDESEEEEIDSKLDIITDPLLGVVDTADTISEGQIPEIESEPKLDKPIKQEQEQEGSDDETVDRQKTISYVCHLCYRKHDTKDLLKTHMEEGHNQQSDGSFKCQECGEMFGAQDYSGLLQHELEHQYKCDDCCKMFSRRMELDRHLKLHEPCNVVCPTCREAFSSKASMIKHKQIHETPTYTCSYCPEGFTQMRILRYHVAMLHPEQPQSHSCGECDQVFFIPDRLQRHMRTVHDNDAKTQCDMCPKSFKKLSALENHKYKAHAVKPTNLLSCPLCAKTFTSKIKFIRHKSAEHRKTYSCEGCVQAFPSLKAVKEHRAKEHPELTMPAMKCTQCDQRFATMSKRIKHERSLHGSGKVFTCSECPVKYGDRYAWERHLAVHKGEQNYECEKCGNKFHTERHMRRHMMHVHDGKPTRKRKPDRVECEECGKTFSDKRFMIRHQQREHLGHKDFDEQTCPICSQTFSGKSSLRRHHRRIHKGIKDHTSKDFQCELCAKTFTFKQSMHRHMQSAHKLLIPQYECPVCHKFFANQFNLLKHQENHGGNACKPRKKRQKMLNVPQKTLVNIASLQDKTQFIEIQVMDAQNFQNAENIENIENINLSSLPPGATWTIQPDAATGDDATAYQVSTDDGNFAQSQFVLEQGSDVAADIQQIENAEVESADPQMFISDEAGQEFVAGDAIEQIGIQGNVVEVPVGVKFIQLGEKFVRLDGGV